MTVAEEVFRITLQLNEESRCFRWKNWQRAWEAVSVRQPRRAGYMSMDNALKTQVQAGTIRRLDKGFYFFEKNDPVYPFYTKRNGFK